ncbi:probable carboxylesterase 2 [Dendrobium catenatum]|nr:probable carboxylesterase 2 [Dendrobium catenatum]
MSSAAASFLNDEIIFELPTTMLLYQSGRVERLVKDDIVPPALDPNTRVKSKDVIINPSTGLSARLYLPPSSSTTSNSDRKKLPVLLYYHGGAFCVMSAASAIYHNYLNSLTAKADVLTVSVDYRLAPENPLPAAYDDSWEALRWVMAGSDAWLSDFGNLGKIFLAGDSAGGNISHNLGLKLGSAGMKVEGMVLIHSYFWGKERIGAEGDENRRSKRTAKDADGLWPVLCPGRTDLDDPWINPMADSAPSLVTLGCRRALVCVAEIDLLRDRGRLYYDKLKQSGWDGEAEFMETEGEDHVFFLFKPHSSKAEEFEDRLVSFFNKV